MEPTLIRNLSDHHGNNLAHVLAACGHVQALAWLVGTCGHVLSEALADENKHGLTPSVAAVRVSPLPPLCTVHARCTVSVWRASALGPQYWWTSIR